jgi:hypothetical protein
MSNVMATTIVANDAFSGSLRVLRSGDVEFCRRHSDEWHSLTGLRDNGDSWSMMFGRFGTFVLRKREMKTLDETLRSLFAKARAAKEEQQQVKVQQTSSSQGLNSLLSSRKVERKSNPTWEAFLSSRIEAEKAGRRRRVLEAQRRKFEGLALETLCTIAKTKGIVAVPNQDLTREEIITELMAIA